MPFEVKNAPAVFAHMHIPRTPRLVLSPGPAKSPPTVPQWVSTPASRLKKAHSDAASRDLQSKERRVAGLFRQAVLTTSFSLRGYIWGPGDLNIKFEANGAQLSFSVCHEKHLD